MSEAVQPPKPKRRWYQFSMRTLLLVMLVLPTGVGWIGVRLNRARENWAAIATEQAALEKAVTQNKNLNGHIFVKLARDKPWLDSLFNDPGEDWYCHFVGGSTLGDAGLEHLKALPRLQNLWLRGTKVTDAGLKHLERLPHLRRLELDDTGVTDAGLEHLEGLTNIECLVLGGGNFSDTGLEHLKGMTNLKSLTLRYANITDAGPKHFSGLTSLRELTLEYTSFNYWTSITDAELMHLSGMTNLQRLTLVGNNVTEEGIKKLRKALPNCKITHYRSD
jgi:hypothetical protein